MATLKRVMLILRDGGSWDRGLIFGVSSYVHPWLPWSLRIAFPSAETLKEIPGSVSLFFGFKTLFEN